MLTKERWVSRVWMFQTLAGLRCPMLGVQFVLPKRHTVVLIPSTSECDVIWKQGLDRVNQVTMRSLEIIIQHDWYPYKRGDLDTERHTQGEQDVEATAGIRLMRLQAKERKRQQSTRS